MNSYVGCSGSSYKILIIHLIMRCLLCVFSQLSVNMFLVLLSLFKKYCFPNKVIISILSIVSFIASIYYHKRLTHSIWHIHYIFTSIKYIFSKYFMYTRYHMTLLVFNLIYPYSISL